MIMRNRLQLLLYYSNSSIIPIGGKLQHTAYPPEYRLSMLGLTGFKLLAPWGLSVWDD